ncbi:MAG: transporter substrate-binding domain-containing protein [Defluviitaleaceae bacterium]|nr:transporter substrate-binding domain-containing protein [Defluviitaleaceae bacterium]
MKKIFFTLLMLTLVVILVGCGSNESERTTIIMGTSADFPPFEFIAEGGQGRHGQYDGIDVAIAVRIAEHIGADLVIHDADFGALIMALNGGSIDFIAAGMTIRPDREEEVSFSIPYFNAMQYIVVRAGNTDIASANDLSNTFVGVQIGTTGDFFVTDNVGGTEPIRYNRANEAFMALRAGQLDAVVIDSATALMFVGAAGGELAIVRDYAAFESEYYGIAVRHEDTDLLASINEVISEMVANGEIEALFAYFSPEDDE